MASVFTFSLEQWVFVALVFVAGWLLGLASHPGGRKWRERYAAEREAHATARKDADARIAAADARAREVERDHARLAAAAPVTPATVTSTRTDGATVVAPRRVDTRVSGLAPAPGEQRGWFDWGPRRV